MQLVYSIKFLIQVLRDDEDTIQNALLIEGQ